MSDSERTKIRTLNGWTDGGNSVRGGLVEIAAIKLVADVKEDAKCYDQKMDQFSKISDQISKSQQKYNRHMCRLEMLDETFYYFNDPTYTWDTLDILLQSLMELNNSLRVLSLS